MRNERCFRAGRFRCKGRVNPLAILDKDEINTFTLAEALVRLVPDED
jgi:hypothetical protein